MTYVCGSKSFHKVLNGLVHAAVTAAAETGSVWFIKRVWIFIYLNNKYNKHTSFKNGKLTG